MADTVQFDLVSPERMLASVAASAVQIPGADGDLTAMAGHAPVITTLRPGIVTAATAQGEVKYLVTGGFAEIGPDSISLLAERGVPVAELTQATFDALLSEARAAAANASGDAGDAAQKLVADYVALAGQLGLNAA